jgi:hypothetical protein
MKELGSSVFDMLFPGNLHDVYLRSRDYAETQGLRLYLYISDPLLADIPWELAYDKRNSSFLALDRQISFIRVWPSHTALAPVSLVEQLRILAIFPSPREMAAIDVETEMYQLQEALQIPLDRKQIDLHFLRENVTLHNLQQKLATEDFHILHITGHGTFDSERQSAVLALEDDEGMAAFVTAEQLRVLLGGAGLRLATVIAAESGFFGWGGRRARDATAIAPALTEAGIPAVVALQSIVTYKSATGFVRAFYSAIADQFPVDLAVVQARRAIYFEEPESVWWAVPVLYASGRISDQILHFVDKPQAEQEQASKIGQSISNVGGGAVTGVDISQIRVSQKVSQNYGEVRGVWVGSSLEEKAASREAAAEAPEEMKGLDPAEIAHGINTLKKILRADTNLTPRERVAGLALIEQVDYQLSAQRLDRNEIAKLMQQLASISPKVTKQADDFHLELGV